MLKRLAIAVPAIIAIVAVFATFVGLYRDLGIDRIASTEESRDWAAVRPGSCEDLRRFVGRHSNGAHTGEAQALLNARTTQTQTHWRPTETALRLTSTLSADAALPDQGSAQSAALAQSRPEAERLCRDLAQTSGARLRGAEVRAISYQCERFREGWACAVRGEALCRMEDPVEVQSEMCGRRREM